MAKAKVTTDTEHMFENRGYADIRLIGHGHNMLIPKGETVRVPPPLHGQALQFGAIPLDPSSIHVEGNVDKPIDKPVEETDPVYRRNAIKKVVESMMAENAADEWSATGRPKIEVVRAKVGFKIAASEITDVWNEVSVKS